MKIRCLVRKGLVKIKNTGLTEKNGVNEIGVIEVETIETEGAETTGMMKEDIDLADLRTGKGTEKTLEIDLDTEIIGRKGRHRRRFPKSSTESFLSNF